MQKGRYLRYRPFAISPLAADGCLTGFDDDAVEVRLHRNIAGEIAAFDAFETSLVLLGQVGKEGGQLGGHVVADRGAHDERTVRDQARTPDFDEIVGVDGALGDFLVEGAGCVAVLEVAYTRGIVDRDIDLAVTHGQNVVFVAAIELGRGEEGFVRGAGGLRNLGQRDQVAGGRIRVGIAELLALGRLDVGDPRGLQRQADGIIAGGAVGLLGGEDRGDRLRVLDVDAGIAGSAEFGEVERAAEQALDNAVIVGGGEQRNLLEAELGLQVVGQALVVTQPVGFVFSPPRMPTRNSFISAAWAMLVAMASTETAPKTIFLNICYLSCRFRPRAGSVLDLDKCP